jgi:hypothetical protein
MTSMISKLHTKAIKTIEILIHSKIPKISFNYKPKPIIMDKLL